VLGDEEVEAKINPSRERISTNEKCVLDAYHETSAVWRSNLSLNNRNSHGEEAYTQTLQSTADNECLEVGSESLDEGGEKVDETTQSNTLLSSNHISKVTGDEGADGGGDLETSHENAGDIRVNVFAGAVGTSEVPEESRNEYRVD
jgi:hypothetical protein